jgi:serine/threonine-protein kinase
VISKLGEGGMGVVYLAEQLSIDRKVALKVLQGDFARDNEFVRRFRDEARAAASVKHRNVVTVYDYDQAEDGSLFIAMEYLEGQTLGEIIRQEGAMESGRAVRLGMQIAEGLEAAHRAGVIHRDIKPQNIMVVGAGDEVKLMDFGIARLRDSGTAGLTRAGVMMGTPEYMAPEQIEGGEITERTDVYALGVVLYQMLTRAVPFSAPTAQAVLTKQLYEAAVPLRQVRAEVSPAMEQVVMQALEKTPERRQWSMEEVVKGLRLVKGQLADTQFAQTLVVYPQTLVVTPQTPEAPQTLITPGSTATSWLAGRRSMLVGVGAGLVVLVGSVAWVIHSWGPQALRQSSTVQTLPAVAPTRPVLLKDVEDAARREAEATQQAEAERQREQEEAARKRTETKARKQMTQMPPKVAMTTQDPNRLRSLVEERLRRGGFLKQNTVDELGVTVEMSGNGIVSLMGILRDRQGRAEAVRLAREIPGVMDVRQQINVRESWEQPSN